MTPQDFQNWVRTPGRRPLVMGVLNVTPDSFSDGGQFADPHAAAAHALEMAAAGADILDIGGESTRPGSRRQSAGEQLARVVPVLQRLAGRSFTISIDTTLGEVARAALDAGASVINDISAGREDPALFALAAQRRVPIVLMHMKGTPATMQDLPTYVDVVGEIAAFLRQRVEVAAQAGVEQILVDPGIGFGKTLEHNLTLLRRLKEIAGLGRPVVLGTSRKGFIGQVLGEPDPARRLMGTAATVAWGLCQGADVVRVHDVQAMAQVVRMVEAIRGAGGAGLPDGLESSLSVRKSAHAQ